MTIDPSELESVDMLSLEEKQVWTETTTRQSVSPSRPHHHATHSKQSPIVSELEHSYARSVASESVASSLNASLSLPAESVCSVESRTDAPVRSAESVKDFWTQYLTGAMACHFPEIGKDESGELALEELVLVDHSAMTGLCESTGVSLSSMIMAVWAVVLYGHTLVEEVCFGYGMDAKEYGLHRTPISKDTSLSDIARQFDAECRRAAWCRYLSPDQIYLDHKQFFNTFVSLISNDKTGFPLPELLPVSVSGRNVAH